MVGAGAVVHRRGRVLLVRRKFPPNEGRWALPGGLVELGEEVEKAVVREVKEETGLDVAVGALLDVSSDIHSDGEARVKYHYVLVDYAARAGPGEVSLNGESSDFGWFSEPQAEKLEMSEGTRKVLKLYFRAGHRPLR